MKCNGRIYWQSLSGGYALKALIHNYLVDAEHKREIKETSKKLKK